MCEGHLEDRLDGGRARREHEDAIREVNRFLHVVGDEDYRVTLLAQDAQELDADLTVIGAHPRGLLFDAVVGSSRLIIDTIPGDVLVVRAVRGDRG